MKTLHLHPKTTLPKRRPRMIYGACINLSGLYSAKPLRCYFDKYAVTWYDTDANVAIDQLGLVVKQSVITYASTKESDVSAWIAGVRSAMTLLRQWSHSSFAGLQNFT